MLPSTLRSLKRPNSPSESCPRKTQRLQHLAEPEPNQGERFKFGFPEPLPLPAVRLHSPDRPEVGVRAIQAFCMPSRTTVLPMKAPGYRGPCFSLLPSRAAPQTIVCATSGSLLVWLALKTAASPFDNHVAPDKVTHRPGGTG